MKIAIASGKGGTGKTTLSVNLASYISTNIGKNVTLVDLDVEEPNAGLFLKNKSADSQTEISVKVPIWNIDNCTHCGKCALRCNFNAIIKIPGMTMVFPELCHNCFLCSDLCPGNALPMTSKGIGFVYGYSYEKMNFFEGRLNVGVEKSVPLIRETKLIADKASDSNTVIIYDSPPGTSCSMIEAVKESDFVILITEPTPFGLHDLKIATATVREINKKRAVVINRAEKDSTIIEQWCRKEKIPVIGKIKNRREIAELYSKGSLIFTHSEEIRKELASIYEKIYSEIKN